MTDRSDALDRARKDAGLSHEELWIRYFSLTGMRTAVELQAIVFGALLPSAHDRELLAHALNERFTELGRDHPVPYVLPRTTTPTAGDR